MRRAAALALWLCAIIPAFAQNADTLPVVGILRSNTADSVEPFATGFRDALAALGLVDAAISASRSGLPMAISIASRSDASE